MSKIIAVIGATGAQGGSVISTLLADGTYKIRGVTRNVTSAQSQALAAQGVEMIQADLNDEQALIKAFKGVSAIYAVTDFMQPFGKYGPEVALKGEVAQGINLANAASKTSTLEHYIWSTLPNGKELSGGKHIVPHFEGKNQIDAYIKNNAKLLAKTTFLWNTFYASNLMFPFTPNLLKSSGKYVWLQPTPASTPVTMLGDADANIGPFVSSILKRPNLTLPGKFVVAAVEEMTHGEILATWGRATGKETEYIEVILDDFDRLWPMWGKEMGLMMQMWGDLGHNSGVERRF
ncbi:hypothetical protein V500_01855 [Pseudogymnoascus sp. VKM F-4518 (FW-2643)]|nr:hypothetical protein V500_01855 [Pseudogymnoascus sp. VKM F-4518 (FW-2643)]